MNYNQIDEFIEMLTKLNVFLVRLKNEQAELSRKRNIEKTVKNYLDGFSFSTAEELLDQQRRCAVLENLQLNNGNKFGTTEDFDLHYSLQYLKDIKDA